MNITLAIKYVLKINVFQNFQIREKNQIGERKKFPLALLRLFYVDQLDRSATTHPLPTSYPTNRLLFPPIPTITQLRPEFPGVVSTALERASGP